MNADILGKGYAIAHSSGNNTGTHYNLQVAGETAMMTKERFIERYGVPLYTVGLGGSGGAIQQYILAQNQPGMLDAALPVQSYPDMVTQTIHVGDCELLEHYMDATDRANREVARDEEPQLAGRHERRGGLASATTRWRRCQDGARLQHAHRLDRVRQGRGAACRRWR